MGKTIYTINDVHVQALAPQDFKIVQVNAPKKNLKYTNYMNAGFFAGLAGGGTLPVGNLAIDGKIITDAKTQATWLNTARHKQTTIVVHTDNTIEMVKTDNLRTVPNLKYAISGVPIIRNGRNIMRELSDEGYFGNEMYDTWHGFLGIRNGRLILVGAKCSKNNLIYLIDTLGITDGIKLDGGGSFIMKSDKFVVATNENRKIDNIITW